MFSKAKRFDDKPVGCGADALYEAPPALNSIGGVIPKVERFGDAKAVCSDVESVLSDKSSQIFRTPKAIRRFPGTPVHKRNVKCEPITKDLFEELLAAKTVELRNKDETIKEYELQMKEMKDKIYDLEYELANANLDPDKAADQSKVDYLHLIEDLEAKLQAKEVQMKALLDEKSLGEKEHQILKEFFLEFDTGDCVSLNEKLSRVKMVCDDKSKAMSTLEKCKKELEDQNDKLNEQLTKTRDDYDHKVKTLETDFSNRLKYLNENATEKMRICEIQFEERYKDLQSYSDFRIDQEINERHQKLQVCQEMAEKELIKSELKIEDLHNVLDRNDQKILHLSTIIDELNNQIISKDVLIKQLQTNLSTSENHIISQKESYENQIASMKKDIDNINREKKVFSLTLENHRQTLEVISTRLRNSDEDVENFKTKLESALGLNKLYEAEIVELQIEFSNFQDEYKQLLMSIVNSKATLDKSHDEIVSNNAKLMDSFDSIKTEMIENISSIKSELLKDVEDFKQEAVNYILELETKVKKEHESFIAMKGQCDEAYSKINECQILLSDTEIQLEMKDQELNELGTENDRLCGTLAASEQEKNELNSLLKGFVKLAEEKDAKITEHASKIETCEDDKYSLECRIKKLNQFLEATDFIVKEKDSEIIVLNKQLEKLYGELENAEEDCHKIQSTLDTVMEKVNHSEYKCNKYDEMHGKLEELKIEINVKNNKITNLENEISIANVHMTECSEDMYKIRIDNLEKELTEITAKYTDLLGHHNYKQKIKHITDLKTQNQTLTQENEKLVHTVNKQTSIIEKLKKELECTNNLKSPLLQKKSILQMNSPHGKENRNSSMTQSPNRLESPLSSRPNTPLRDLNR